MAGFKVGGAAAFKESIIGQIRKNFLKNINLIRREIKKDVDYIIEEHFKKSPTVVSLQARKGGPDNLRRDLGLEDPESKVETILQLMQQAIRIPPIKVQADKISFQLEISPNLIDNLLLNPIAIQDATKINGREGKVPFIPWLSWLLIEGASTTLANHNSVEYYVKMNKPRRRGRSGEIGFMFPTNADKDRPFSIEPPEHRGTESDNFVTRIFEAAEKQIIVQIPRTLELVINKALGS